MRSQVRTTLLQIIVRRLILTFERRFTDNWNLKASELANQEWAEIQSLLMDRVDDTLQRRVDLLLGENGEIARDLDTQSDLMAAAMDDQGEMMRLFGMLTQGKVITFDERTHRRKMKATLRLTYIFLAARQLEGKPLEEIQGDILSHLEAAQDKLALVWGGAELDRLHKAGRTLSNLTESWKSKIIDEIGADAFEQIREKPLDQLQPDIEDTVIALLGRAAQNRLYRQLLLSKISELWVEYLTRVEALRVSVRMEAYGQKDPLVAYKGQASEMFSELLSDIRAGVIAQMFRARLVSSEELKKMQAASQQSNNGSSTGSQPQPKKKSRKRH